MANLGGKTTNGEVAWNKYVYKNTKWRELKLESEYDGALMTRKSNKLVTILEFNKGDPIKLERNSLRNILGFDYAEVKIKNKSGFVLPRFIRKPTNFKPTGYEVEVVNMINKVIAENGNIPIDIKIKNMSDIYKGISGAIQVDSHIKRNSGIKADPKADIILYMDKGRLDYRKNIYISHKKEGGPEAFQQYGGVSKTSGADIYDHPETRKFLKAVIKNIEDDKLQQPLFMKVRDSRLKNMSIFGPDFGHAFGLQHTQVIGQGLPKLKITRSENVWELDFSSHMSTSGDLSHFTGGYTPVFAATYRAGRGFEFNGIRYNGARVGIYPIKLIETRSGVQEIK